VKPILLFNVIEINHFEGLFRFRNTLKRSVFLDLSWNATHCLIA